MSANQETDRSLRLYCDEIAKFDLLTREQEIALARQIRKGDHESRVQAREILIKSNLRLVVTIARDYDGRGLPLGDLINEGNEGLIKAVDRYDPTLGKLSNFATWWITSHITYALYKYGRIVRVPIRAYKATGQVLSFISLDGFPNLSDDETNEHSLHESFSDDRAVLPSVTLEQNDMKDLVNKLLMKLDKRELNIMHRHYGFNGYASESFRKISRRSGLTARRIQQLHNDILSKLRYRMKFMETMELVGELRRCQA